MPTITFEDKTFPLSEGESVLECLVRGGHEIPSSCRSGVCHSCMLRASSGDISAAAQKGLKDAYRVQGYFLACCCYPEGDLTVVRADDATRKIAARVLRKEPLNDRVLRVLLESDTPLDYFPGQFVNFVRPGGLVRSFSLASVPALDNALEFHVALVPGGRMSGWLHTEANPGDSLELLGPLGNCFYVAGNPEQPILMVGTGTGLAPLYGILRDALHQGHNGPIHLFHGALVASDLYLSETLRDLEREHPNFTYHACVRDEAGDAWMKQGAVDTLALEAVPNLKGWKVFLCGNPELVKQVQRKVFMAGANMKDIHADAFLPAGGG